MESALKSFAFKRAILSSVIAGIVNLIIVYLSLKGEVEVPLFASVAEIWNHSLIGALIPRSLILSFIITITSVRAARKETAGKKLDKNIGHPWIKVALKQALLRALIAFVLVILLALILRMFFSTYAILPLYIVIPLVGIFAALIAFSMTYSAIYSINKTVSPSK